MFRPSAGACALALLSLSTGCRLDQGLQGKDGVVDGSIDSSPALDSDTDSGSDTSLPECAEFAPATTGAAAENLACGTRGAGNPEAWSAAVEFVYEAPEAATWHARGANVPALILRPRGDACSQGDGLACLFTATRDLSVAVYTAGLRTPFAVGEPIEGDEGRDVPTWLGIASGDEAAIVDFVDTDGSTFDNHVIRRATSGRQTASIVGNADCGWGKTLMLPTDLDADGNPEIVTCSCVYDLVAEEERFCYGGRNGFEDMRWNGLAVADLDLDGIPEIANGGVVFYSTGVPWWRADFEPDGPMQPFIIQADGDPEAEIGWVSAEWMLYEHDGTPKFDSPRSYGRSRHMAGPPCVGDFDGDGVAEAAWADGDKVVMVEMDGSLAWTVPAEGLMGTGGGGEVACSGWDVDADGALEVLFADRLSFRILDGRTGATLFEETRHSGQSTLNLPVVADIDDDGHGEIVLATGCPDEACEDWGIIAVFGHPGGAWPAAGPAWPSFDYAVRNISSEGIVPATPPDFWNDPGTYRGRLATDDTLPLRADLVGAVTDVCAESCDDGPVHVALQAGNQGPVDVPEGLPYALYAVDESGDRLVATGTLPALPAYTWAAGWEVTLTPADLGSRGLRLVVDDDGADRPQLWECEEGNNEAVWVEAVCP